MCGGDVWLCRCRFHPSPRWRIHRFPRALSRPTRNRLAYRRNACQAPPPSASVSYFACRRKARLGGGFLRRASSRRRPGVLPRRHRRSAFPMQRDDEGKNPPCRVVVAVELALEPFHEKVGRLVVKRAASHVDRFDLSRHRGPDGRVIAFANHTIVLEKTTERSQREN